MVKKTPRRFDGTLEELKNFVRNDLRITGEWSFDEKNNKDVFRVKGGKFNGATINWWASKKTINFQAAPNTQEQLKSLYDEKYKPSDGSDGHVVQHKSTPAGQGRKIFIVYGHDNVAKEQLELILRRLDLDPFILGNTSGGGQTIIEALEGKIGRDYSSDFGIVLMTPDDKGYAQKEGESKIEPRARQNVVLEAGMLLSSLTRARVVFMVKGHLEKPSDLDGVITLNFNDHVKEITQKLVERLREAEFKIDPNKASSASN